MSSCEDVSSTVDAVVATAGISGDDTIDSVMAAVEVVSVRGVAIISS